MSDTALSKSTKITCTSAIVNPPAPSPTPIGPGPPNRTGPSIVPLNGGARGICNLGGGPAAKAEDPIFERFQQINLEWSDIEPAEGKYD
jgi:hypothetical protein